MKVSVSHRGPPAAVPVAAGFARRWTSHGTHMRQTLTRCMVSSSPQPGQRELDIGTGATTAATGSGTGWVISSLTLALLNPRVRSDLSLTFGPGRVATSSAVVGDPVVDVHVVVAALRAFLRRRTSRGRLVLGDGSAGPLGGR